MDLLPHQDISPAFIRLKINSDTSEDGSIGLFTQLSDKDLDLLSHYQYNYSNHGMDDVICTSSTGKETLNFESLNLLFGPCWLNDSVVNFWFRHVLPRFENILNESTQGRKRCYFYSTFFLQNLFDEYNADVSMRTYNYSKVLRWADQARMNPFLLELIFCPYNYTNMHWGLGVIYVQMKKIIWYDSLPLDSCRRKLVEERLQGLLYYMNDEWFKHFDSANFEDAIFNQDDWTLIICDDAPRQLNGET